MPDTVPEFVPAGMRTTFVDDFSSGTLDPSSWGTPYSQSFKSTPGSKADPKRVSITDHGSYHTLNITASRDAKTGVVTTGGLMSKRFLPPAGGRYEVRARLTPGVVKCPLMLYPHSWPPEIDVFECTDPARKHFDANFHYADKSKAPKQSFALDITQYHTYGCTYRGGFLFWNIDGYNVGEAIATKVLPQMYPTLQTECAPQKTAVPLGNLYVRWIRLLEFV